MLKQSRVYKKGSWEKMPSIQVKRHHSSWHRALISFNLQKAFYSGNKIQHFKPSVLIFNATSQDNAEIF